MNRCLVALVLALAVALAACSGGDADPGAVTALPDIDPPGMRSLLAEADRPVVVNIWASWCIPCRSEAPLLRRAVADVGDRVRFVGIAVRDNRNDSAAFVEEFDLGGLEHYFDATGSVPADLGGFGVPQTWFFAPGGELIEYHGGIIDERTLALQIDELLRRSG